MEFLRRSRRGLTKLVSIRRCFNSATYWVIDALETGEYNANNPQPSHFTQVVWKGSQQLGCAVQQCNGIFPSQYGVRRNALSREKNHSDLLLRFKQANYYVCEYFPQGNVLGQFM
jgi:hypothetical protein